MTRAAAFLAFCVLLPCAAPGQEALPLPKRIIAPANPAKIRGIDVAASVDTFPLRVLAEIEGTPEATIALGDTDHDGRNEIIKLADSLLCSYRIYEEQGNNLYTREYSGPCLMPRWIGDLDGDSLSDLVGESSPSIRVYESTTYTAYPTALVWSSPPLGNVLRDASVGDTDRDGRLEIVTSNDSFGPVFVIFENRGDNEYTLVYADTIAYFGNVGNKAIGDLDGDGLLEIAISGSYGRVRVYESTADDTWGLTWKVNTGTYNTYATAVGPDTDGNGRAELFVMGNRDDETGRAPWTTLVYEAPSDDNFVEVASLVIDDGYLGGPYSAVVNLDQFGPEEYIMNTAVGLWIYRASAPGQWDLVGHEPDPGWVHAGIFPFDVNQNGRPELVWRGWPTTLIMEYRSGTSDVGRADVDIPSTLTAIPNPAGVQAELRVRWNRDAVTHLSVFDISGRLVERQLLLPGAQGQLLWPTRHLASGVYLLRLEGAQGQPLATGRALVVH